MGRPRRSAVQKYHDRVAGHYDHSYDDAYWLWHDALTWDYLKPYLPVATSTPVADFGCGTGKWGVKLAKSGYHVTCVDISANMLDQARARFEQQGDSHRGEFIHADLVDLSAIPDQRFGLIVAFGDPIGCASSPEQAMKEARRTLAPGGILVATFDNRLAALDYYLERGDRDELARFLKAGVTRWLTRDREEQFPITTWSPRELRNLIAANGLELIELRGKTVLPMRAHRQLLADPAERRAWARIEKSLSRDEAAIGRAAHLQAVIRRAP